MKTCKDCIHYERCAEIYEAAGFSFNYEKSCCKQISDRTEWVHLPCKVGDTVYIKGQPVKISFLHIENEITYCVQIDCGELDCFSCPFYEDEVTWEGEHDCGTYGYMEFTENDIGKTVFLTREEAEEALKEQEDKT